MWAKAFPLLSGWYEQISSYCSRGPECQVPCKVCFSPSKYCNASQRRSTGAIGLTWALQLYLGAGFENPAWVKDLHCFWYAACVSTRHACPLPAQRPPWAYASFDFLSLTLLSSLWYYSWPTVGHAACQVWSVWGLSVSGYRLWRSDHRQKQGCLSWVACVSASNGCPHSAEPRLWHLVLSGSHRSFPKQVQSIWLTKADACPGVVTENSTATHAGFNSLPPPALGANSQANMCS